MFGFERKREVSNKINIPVTSADEWFEREGYTTWPLPIPSEGELDLSWIKERLETQESLMKDLKNHASFDIGLLDQFHLTLNGVEEIVSKYAGQFLEIKNDNDTMTGSERMMHAADKQFITSPSPRQQRNKKSDSSAVSRKWNVESAIFPGFRSSELPPLPGSLETPQLLNKVTNIQSFSGSFKRVWKRYFLSEATVAILQDTFWWWFLYKFQPNPENQAYLFNRLADSFVGLFLSITSKSKDLFFQKFADCLAQAIYAAFCESFPMSFKLFGDEFREDLLNTMSEWFTGIRPPQGASKLWNLDLLEAAEIKSLQEDRTQQLKSSLSFNQSTLFELDTPQQDAEKQMAYNLSQLKLNRNAKESHQVGPGPQFQRFVFNLHGKSPLIAHFFSANRLQVDEPAALKKLVTRTEVEKYPPPCPTYQDLIQERKKEAKLAKSNYVELMAKHASQSKQRTHTRKLGSLKGPRRNEEVLPSLSQASNVIEKKLVDMKLKKSENGADGITTDDFAGDDEEMD